MGLDDLKVMTQEKEQATVAASAAAAAAKEELHALELRQKSVPIAAQPLKQIIRGEINLLETKLKVHEERIAAIIAESSERKVTWTHEKELMGAQLHRAQVQTALAE